HDVAEAQRGVDRPAAGSPPGGGRDLGQVRQGTHDLGGPHLLEQFPGGLHLAGLSLVRRHYLRHYAPKITTCASPAAMPSTAPCRISSHSSSRIAERSISAKSGADNWRVRSAMSLRMLADWRRLNSSSSSF